MLDGVWAAAPDDLFAVGEAGTLAHWNGATWTTTSLDTSVAMHAVWGNGPDDVLAVGDSPAGDATAAIAHWDGTGWSRLASSFSLPVPCGSTPCGLYGVWSSGATDTYVVGGEELPLQGEGFALHWDGTTWLTPMYTPPESTTSTTLTGVWSNGPGDLFVAGQYETPLFR